MRVMFLDPAYPRTMWQKEAVCLFWEAMRLFKIPRGLRLEALTVHHSEVERWPKTSSFFREYLLPGKQLTNQPTHQVASQNPPWTSSTQRTTQSCGSNLMGYMLIKWISLNPKFQNAGLGR